jgi:signal transduction histidine kinase/ActR/RegA family two-component response regulator
VKRPFNRRERRPDALAGRGHLLFAAIVASLAVACGGFFVTWQTRNAASEATERMLEVNDASSELRLVYGEILADIGPLMMTGDGTLVDRVERASRRFDVALDRLGSAIAGDPVGEALFEVMAKHRAVIVSYEDEFFSLMRAGDLAAATQLTLEPEYFRAGMSLGPAFEELLREANASTRRAYVRNDVAERNAFIGSALGFLVVIGLWTAIALDWFKQTRAAFVLNRNLERMVEDRTHRIEEALAQAESANRAKSEFLATMSHEVRTPLNGVLGMAQVLAAEKLTPQQHATVATILDSGRMLMSILNDVLDLSKVEAGKLEISPVAFDLRRTFQRLHELFRPRAEEKNIKFEIVCEPSVPAGVSGDPVRIRQCVANLVSNAIKFTSEGEVHVRVSAAPHLSAPSADAMLVTVSVSDTGIGLDDEAMGRLFQAFSQADSTTTRRFGGTGLGLVITRRLAELMGGGVTVTSEPNVGSTFVLTFLAAPAKLVAGAKENDQSRRLVKLSGARVLIVDDNAINRQVARMFLEPHQVRLTEAADGVQALEALASHGADLVLMDIHMPVMDGLETLKRIRAANTPWRDVPVIALTADAMQGDRERFVSRGMNGYISKPLDQREAIGEIVRVLGTSAPRAADAA